MTIEEKAKAYDEALKQVKKELAACGSMNCDAARLIFRLFPQLRESEDEEMLNSCISSIEESKENRYAYKENDGDTSYDREIAWLKSLRPQPQQNMSIGFMIYLDEHRPDGKMCLSNAECNEIETAFKNQSWDTIIRYIEKYQPHWKPSNEQINYLGAAVIEAQRRHNESTDGFPRYRVLKELYEQLLKL